MENDEVITASRIKEIYLGKDVRNRTLLEVFKLHNEMVKSRVGVDFSTSTYMRYQTTYDHVSNFLLHQYKLADILLKQIQYSFITDLEHYLKIIRTSNHTAHRSTSAISGRSSTTRSRMIGWIEIHSKPTGSS